MAMRRSKTTLSAEQVREYKRLAEKIDREERPALSRLAKARMAEHDARRIEEPKIQRDACGKITAVSFAFGPHHFVEVMVERGRVKCAIGATHHGVRADAAEVNGAFERMIDELKRGHPQRSF
jgi:hypothetical protein